MLITSAVLAALFLAASPAARAEDPVAPLPKVKFEKGKKDGAAAGKPLDLSSLGVGRVVPGPSSGPDPTPSGAGASASEAKVKAILLAGISEFMDYNRPTVLEYFSKVFPTFPIHGGSPATLHEGHIALAGDILRRMVKEGKITVKTNTSKEDMGDGRVSRSAGGPTASADWGEILDADGGLASGEFRVEGLNTVEDIGRGGRTCAELFKQDQFANSVLHEISHMYFTIFRAFKAQDQMASPPTPRVKFSSAYYWKGGALNYCSGESQCNQCGINRDTGKYHWSFHGRHAARGGADEYTARELSDKLCQIGSCKAYERVLAPAF